MWSFTSQWFQSPLYTSADIKTLIEHIFSIILGISVNCWYIDRNTSTIVLFEHPPFIGFFNVLLYWRGWLYSWISKSNYMHKIIFMLIRIWLYSDYVGGRVAGFWQLWKGNPMRKQVRSNKSTHQWAKIMPVSLHTFWNSLRACMCIKCTIIVVLTENLQEVKEPFKLSIFRFHCETLLAEVSLCWGHCLPFNGLTKITALQYFHSVLSLISLCKLVSHGESPEEHTQRLCPATTGH